MARLPIVHLARRFFGSVRPGPPRPADEAWALRQLGPGETALWDRMRNPDRRHAVEVARAVEDRWPTATGQPGGHDTTVGGDGPPREVLAAALLHDVGKVDADLRTPARVLATLVWGVLDDDRAARWAERAPEAGFGPLRDPRRRLGRYRRHPEIGAELLRSADADPLTAAWAEEHHRPAERWTVPAGIGQLLKDCDDD